MLSQRSNMSTSIKSCRPTLKSKTTTGLQGGHVTLNEIFDKSDSTTASADKFLDREELPNERISLYLPDVGLLYIKDLKGLKWELAAEGLELTVENGNLKVSGYALREDYNGQREVKATILKHLTSSKSFS